MRLCQIRDKMEPHRRALGIVSLGSEVRIENVGLYFIVAANPVCIFTRLFNTIQFYNTENESSHPYVISLIN